MTVKEKDPTLSAALAAATCSLLGVATNGASESRELDRQEGFWRGRFRA